MSTAVAQPKVGLPITHKITWGTHTWVCINPYCNGYHHYYVPCGR